jgi:GMP synthase-like glutamine amidotransferase
VPRALVLDHDGHCPAGTIGRRLVDHGFELIELVVAGPGGRARPGLEFPEPTEFDLVVPMGSPWSVYDRDTVGTWIDAELDLLRRAVDAEVPVLGVCFGGQALAAALGATVERAPAAEVGWVEVDTSAPELVPPGPWLEWHIDRFDAPDGSEIVATTEASIQAYRLGPHLGLQFHPEITPVILEGWMTDSERADLERRGVDPAALLEDTERRAAEAEGRSAALLDAWLA